MLYRNLLLVVFVLGMVFAIPVKDKKEEEVTVSLVTLEALPTAAEVETITFEHYEEEETEAVEVTPAPEDDDDEKKDDDKKEEKKEKDEKKEKKEKKEKTTEAPEEAETGAAEEDVKVKDDTDDIEAILPESDEEQPPFIPENEEPDVDVTVCSKDLLLMGNKIEEHSVCDDIYDACTQKELLSIIIYYYSKSSPVSIEYTIFEGINKGSVSEQCGNILINSKVFLDDTTVIEQVDDAPVVEKITELYQDVPTQAPNDDDKDDDDDAPELGDNFAEASEDDIEENVN